MQEERKVRGSLVGIDGNAFMLMGYFQKLAREQGFGKEWIKQVLDEAIPLHFVTGTIVSSDYNHLVVTLLNYMEEDTNE